MADKRLLPVPAMKVLTTFKQILCAAGIIFGARYFIVGVGAVLFFGQQTAVTNIATAGALLSLLPLSILALFFPRISGITLIFVTAATIYCIYKSHAVHSIEYFNVPAAFNLCFAGLILGLELLPHQE